MVAGEPEAGMKFEGGLWATAAVLGIAATVGISTTPTKTPVTPRAQRCERETDASGAKSWQDGKD